MTGDKWKRHAKNSATESPLVAEPTGFMAASQAVARVEEGLQRRRREVVATSKQPNLEGGPAADPDVMATIRQLPTYL